MLRKTLDTCTITVAPLLDPRVSKRSVYVKNFQGIVSI